jgi:disulfide bond formation protein DsbB
MAKIKLFAGTISIFLVIFSVIIQEIYSLDPCPLCITQRIVFLISGVVFLTFYLRPFNKWIEFFVLLAINLFGLVFALRHVLIQKKIIQIPAECGIDLGYMFDNFPLTEMFELVFRGTGDCSEIDWTLIGITIPEWSALWFVIFIIITVVNLKKFKGK